MGDTHPGEGHGPGAEPEHLPGARFQTYPDQAMVEASADGIVAVDERGIIRVCNPAAEALFARSA
jgi:PAS domain-containing protein